MLRHEFEQLAQDCIIDALNLDWLKPDQVARLMGDLWEQFGRRWSDEQLQGVFEVFRREGAVRITRGMNYTAALTKALNEAYSAWLDRHPAKKASGAQNAQERACPNGCRFGGFIEFRGPDGQLKYVPCRHCMPGNPRARNRREIESAQETLETW